MKQAGFIQINKGSKQSKPSFISVEQIFEAAHGKYDTLAIDLLGTPNRRMSNRRELRFGTNGSFRISITGNNSGKWNDFETGESGNIISLYQREKSLTFKDAIDYLANVLGVRADIPHISKEPLQTQRQPKEQAYLENAKEIAQRLNAVLDLHMKAKPIEGTIAETYLKKERAIMGALPSDLKYIPKGTQFMYKGEYRTIHHHCFAAFGKNKDGELSSVQLTQLDEQGKRAISKGHKTNKYHYGIAGGSFITIQEGKDRVFIAEGVETALSIKEAFVKGKIVASLGIHNIPNYQGPEKEIIICADNDEHKLNSKTYQAIEKAQEHFKSQEKSVSIIKPLTPGDDFNDVIKKQGVKGIQEYVKEYADPGKQTLQLSQEKHKIEFSFKTDVEGFTYSNNKQDSENTQIIFKYIESLLKDYKTYKGTHLADKVKTELDFYIQHCQKDATTMQKLHQFNPDLTKDIETYSQNHARNKSIGKGR